MAALPVMVALAKVERAAGKVDSAALVGRVAGEGDVAGGAEEGLGHLRVYGPALG